MDDQLGEAREQNEEAGYSLNRYDLENSLTDSVECLIASNAALIRKIEEMEKKMAARPVWTGGRKALSLPNCRRPAFKGLFR